MNSDRIREIQKSTGLENSVSVAQALHQVWNECAQESKAEIERKDRLIEQMREALEALQETQQYKSENGKTAGYIQKRAQAWAKCKAALKAAERGGE